jgi:hypothetical protein
MENVQGTCKVVAGALSRMAETPTTWYTQGEDVEDGIDGVAVQVFGTVSRPMLTRAMIEELTIAYRNDKTTKDCFSDVEGGVGRCVVAKLDCCTHLKFLRKNSSTCRLDFITALPQTKYGFDGIVTIVDILTKLAMFIPTTPKVDGVGAATLFLETGIAGGAA